MGFLDFFGFGAAEFSESAHGSEYVEQVEPLVEDQPPVDSRRLLTGLELARDFIFTPKIWFKGEKDKKLHKLKLLRVDRDGDFIVEEPECLDCHEDGLGCDHCDLPHMKPVSHFQQAFEKTLIPAPGISHFWSHNGQLYCRAGNAWATLSSATTLTEGFYGLSGILKK